MIVTGYQARTLLGLSAWTGRKVFQQPVNALVGQAMKASKGKANPAQVNELLKQKLA